MSLRYCGQGPTLVEDYLFPARHRGLLGIVRGDEHHRGERGKQLFLFEEQLPHHSPQEGEDEEHLSNSDDAREALRVQRVGDEAYKSSGHDEDTLT